MGATVGAADSLQRRALCAQRDSLCASRAVLQASPKKASIGVRIMGLGRLLAPTRGRLYESDLAAMRFSINNSNLILLGGADFGVAGFEGTIWRTTDAGQTWTKVFESAQGTSENVTDLEIIADGTDQNMLASFTDFVTQEGGALRSSDGGATWALSSTGLPGGFFRDPDLCAASNNPQVFYLSAWPNFSSTFLFRTTDGGVTWQSTGWTGNGLSGDLVCDPQTIKSFISACKPKLRRWRARQTEVLASHHSATASRALPLRATWPLAARSGCYWQVNTAATLSRCRQLQHLHRHRPLRPQQHLVPLLRRRSARRQDLFQPQDLVRRRRLARHRQAKGFAR